MTNRSLYNVNNLRDYSGTDSRLDARILCPHAPAWALPRIAAALRKGSAPLTRQYVPLRHRLTQPH